MVLQDDSGGEWDAMMDISGGGPGKRPVNPTVPKGPEMQEGSTKGLGCLYYNYYFFNY